jgi:pimeloyl-ACP methyl ester carboxylesterase
MLQVTHEYADLGDVRLHHARTGRGPLIIFLHGFPQCWHMWRHQLEDFGRDHLVLAPDLRGNNHSTKPERLREYGPWPAARDIRALAMSVGRERFVLVGHDWGAATAWTFALRRQPGAMRGMLSWYRREGLGPPEDGTPARGNYAPQITPLTVRVPRS